MSEKRDEALMQPTMMTGLEGVDQVIDYIKNSTPEVKKLIKEECDIIYECRFCRNFFRSIINFVTHKRVYCRNLHKKLDLNGLLDDYQADSRDGLEDDEKSSNSDKSDGTSETVEDKSGAHRQMLDDFSFGKGRKPRVNKKNSGQLRTLNQVARIAKRMGTTTIRNGNGQSVLQLHTLPSIAKVVPETTFENGVQVIKKRVDGILSKELSKTEEKVLMVMPQDLSSRYVNMQLRNRSKNSNYASAAKELSMVDVKIIERLESFDVTVNAENVTCMICERAFNDYELLAYHASVKHNPYSEDNLLCFICGRNYQSKESLRVHFHNRHKDVQVKVMNIRRTYQEVPIPPTQGKRRAKKKIELPVPVNNEEEEVKEGEEEVDQSEAEESEMSEAEDVPEQPEKKVEAKTDGDQSWRFGKHICPRCNKAEFMDPKNLDRHLEWCSAGSGASRGHQSRKGRPQKIADGSAVEAETKSRSVTPQKTNQNKDGTNSEEGSASKRISVRLAERTEKIIEEGGQPLSVLDQAVRQKRNLSGSPERTIECKLDPMEMELHHTEDERKRVEDREKRKSQIDQVLRNSQEILASSSSSAYETKDSEEKEKEGSVEYNVRELLKGAQTPEEKNADSTQAKDTRFLPIPKGRAPISNILKNRQQIRAKKCLPSRKPLEKHESGFSDDDKMDSDDEKLVKHLGIGNKAEPQRKNKSGRNASQDAGNRKRRSLKTPARYADYELSSVGTAEKKKPRLSDEDKKKMDEAKKKESTPPPLKLPKSQRNAETEPKKAEPRRVGRPSKPGKAQTGGAKPVFASKERSKAGASAQEGAGGSSQPTKKRRQSAPGPRGKGKAQGRQPTLPQSMVYEGLRSTPVFLTAQQQEILKSVMDDPAGVCYLCQIKFNMIATARRHVMNHLDFARFVCTQCHAGAFFVSDMRRHLMENHCRAVSAEEYHKNFPEAIHPAYNKKADSLITHCFPEKIGRVAHWRGKVVALECLWGRDFFDMQPQELPERVVTALTNRNYFAGPEYKHMKEQVLNTNFEELGGGPNALVIDASTLSPAKGSVSSTKPPPPQVVPTEPSTSASSGPSTSTAAVESSVVSSTTGEVEAE